MENSLNLIKSVPDQQYKVDQETDFKEQFKDIIVDLINLCQNDLEFIIQCLKCIIRIIETFQNLFDYFIEINNEFNKKGIVEFLEKLIFIENMNDEIIEMSEFILEKIKNQNK